MCVFQLPYIDTSGCQSVMQQDGRPQLWDGARSNQQVVPLADADKLPARPFVMQRLSYIHLSVEGSVNRSE